jgi:hypothetical protein
MAQMHEDLLDVKDVQKFSLQDQCILHIVF